MEIRGLDRRGSWGHRGTDGGEECAVGAAASARVGTDGKGLPPPEVLAGQQCKKLSFHEIENKFVKVVTLSESSFPGK